MPRYLVLDWDHQQLHIVSGTIKSGDVRLEHAVSFAVPHSPNPAQAEELGRGLRERIKAAGISPAPVLVCVGRDRVVLKEIRHPVVNATEEPALVRFQAFKEINDSPSEVILDYTPVSGGKSSTERRALAIVIRRELFNTYDTLCKAAGLKLAGVCPRPFGAAYCAQHAKAENTVAVLTIAHHWGEFCVVKDDEVLLARTLAAPAAADAALLGEIRRNLAVYAGQSPNDPVHALYIADGSDEGKLRERLQDKLAIPVHGLDPLEGTEIADAPEKGRGSFAGAVGLLYAIAEDGRLPINLVKPREPPPVKDPNKRKIALAACLAVVLLGTVVAYAWTRLAAKDREMAELIMIKGDLDKQLATFEDDAKKIKTIGDWVDNRVVWLDELYDLADRWPDINNLRLIELAGDTVQRAGTGKDKIVAKMSIKGITTDDPDPIKRLMDRLVEDGYPRVDPKQMAANRGADSFRFRQTFSTSLSLEHRAPNRYVRRLAPPPPVKDKPEDGGGFDPGIFLQGVAQP